MGRYWVVLLAGSLLNGLTSIFFGHQLVDHLVPANDSKTVTGRVDGEMVPSRHFGIILTPGA